MRDNEPQEWIVEVIHVGDIKDNANPMPTYDLHTTEKQPLYGIFVKKDVWEYKIYATKRELCLSFLTDNH